ncbi:right-handed parallel beta-helix repeat-containing protein [Microvirga terrae]|uniref:Right-handed parallel beta-helix repeat-containing protein n=1 Tax=Microvirga terrae TaxID=2740529 RepID=A0ABY5RNN5_9HYPH|nr:MULTISPECIES: right-handed parallel beta-helix repeat-containing protein [Microvirga]MBQ0823141.1 right-handed parallel beta-helix repeat-containing protein [Microvirga sp. HBU67558]UVF17847.1 right-handed parallel beta-helix repeat-containing protein [Microvirga terrae]
MALFIDASSFGAKANDALEDTAALNAAVRAAYEAYRDDPAGGRVTVVLPAGTLLVKGNGDKSDGAVEMLEGTALQGAGMGRTILKVADGWAGSITGVVRTPFDNVTSNVGVFDLTIDGNRGATTGKIDGFYTGVKPGSPLQDSDIHVARVEVMNCSGYGFDPHEQTLRLTIESSVSHGNGLDGFVADYIVNGIYRNNIAYGNDRHGFNITTTTTGLLLENNIAYGNGSAGVVVQRGSENIGWPSNVRIVGGQYYGNLKEGVLLNMAANVTVDGATIFGNQGNGVRIEGSTGTVVRNSFIFNNAQVGDNQLDEVSIRMRLDSTTGLTYYSTNTQILNNTIYSDGATDARYGIREESSNTAGGDTFIRLIGNAISGTDSGAVFTSKQTWIGSARSNSFKGTGQDEDLSGRSGNDTIRGMGGNDHVSGDGGNDKLYGNSGRDYVFGGNGHDSISGGAGNDILSGNAGRDVFIFDSRLGNSSTDRKVNFDTILDYSAKDDSIWLDNAVFRKLGLGSSANPTKLDADVFHIGTRAKDQNDYILYNKKTGVLSYDSDGSGSRKPVEFAQLKKGLALTYHDFFVV